MIDPDQPVRFRLFIDGRLVDEDWATERNIVQIARHQKLLVDGYDLWMVEAYDPEAPEEKQYVRWGTDASLMADPVMARPGDA